MLKKGMVVKIKDHFGPEYKGMEIRLTTGSKYGTWDGEVIKSDSGWYKIGRRGFALNDANCEVVRQPSPFETSIQEYTMRELNANS